MVGLALDAETNCYTALVCFLALSLCDHTLWVDDTKEQKERTECWQRRPTENVDSALVLSLMIAEQVNSLYLVLLKSPRCITALFALKMLRLIQVHHTLIGEGWRGKKGLDFPFFGAGFGTALSAPEPIFRSTRISTMQEQEIFPPRWGVEPLLLQAFWATTTALSSYN